MMKKLNSRILPSVFTFLLFFITMNAYAQIITKSAGVGVEGRTGDESFPLKIVLFETGGPYVSYVTVELFDTQGNLMLQEVSEGPWLFVDLPPGEYSVRGTRQNGDVESARFSLDQQQREVALMFPARGD